VETVCIVRLFLVEHLIGSAVLDEEGNLVAFEASPRSLDELVEEALRVEEGEASKAMVKVLESIDRDSEIVVESPSEARHVSALGFKVSVEPGNPVAKLFRERIADIAVEQGFVASVEEFRDLVHRVSLEYTRRKLRKAAAKRDLLAAQGIRAIDDIDKTVNLFVARLREWYSVHFPELDNLVPDHVEYVRIVSELGHRDNLVEDNLVKLGFSRAKAARIEEAAEKSIGADLSDFDVKPIQTLASITAELYRLRDSLAEYIDAVMKEVAPNVTALVGSLLGARLIKLKNGTHEKILIKDKVEMILGSFNWLSHKYYQYCAKNLNIDRMKVRRESSILIKNDKKIEEFIKKIND